jgi:hypothetical protein
MTIPVVRTADAWWVLTPSGAARMDTPATTTAQLLADRGAVTAAVTGGSTVPVESLALVSRVTAPCRVIAQMATLRALTRFQRLDPGDLLLTGTPAGTALSAPPRLVQKAGLLLPDVTKWRLFIRSQARSSWYLRDGDIVEAAVATDDGAIDLGRQRTIVRYAR